MSADLDALLPCPFCGKPPNVEAVGENGSARMIDCLTDGCVGPHVSYYGHGVAEKVWNTRAAPDVQRKADALAEAVEAIMADDETDWRPLKAALAAYRSAT